jgi:glycosyltransferase involved in cell wall biosynthesis
MTRNIIIDANEANVTNRVGSNVYAFQLLRHLEKNTRSSDEWNWTIALSEPPKHDMPAPRPNWKYIVIGPKPFWTQLALPFHLFWNKNKYDCSFSPGHYAPRISSIPTVMSVMDLAYLKFPKQFTAKDQYQLSNWTEYGVKQAKAIITISEFSKSEIIKTYHVPERKITVAYPGAEMPPYPERAEKQHQTLRKFKINRPYFLYVGTLQPRKNLITLVKAYERFCRTQAATAVSSPSKKYKRAELKHKDTTPLLVLAGKKGWLADDLLKAVEASPWKKNIILTGFVDDMTKHTLYSNALASVLLGLYEGFGIPPLESMHHGVVPIVSKTSSLPEVVDKAGILVNPLSEEDVAHALTTIIHLSPKKKQELRRLAEKQTHKFSWKNTADVVLSVLQKVVEKKKHG